MKATTNGEIMKSLLTGLLATGIVASLALTTSFAAEKEKKEGKTRGTPYAGKVGAVDKAAKTVTIATKEKSRTYQITSETRISKAGKPATLDDVTVGEEAAAYGHEESGKYIAQSLRVGPRPEGEGKGKTKGKEKKE